MTSILDLRLIHNTYFQIWKIKREGEFARYKPFRDLHNKKLLWHGSRYTNFGGILSQGLRIAPPEAPVVNKKVFLIHMVFIDNTVKFA